jgi:type III restriction enzyme
MRAMILQFEPNLQFQLDAINSVVRLFEGQPKDDGETDFLVKEEGKLNFIDGIANRLIISGEQILQNLQNVQRDNKVEVSNILHGMNFSVEMETGTGKTYVYLRTIYELHKQYGFKKFVIVVPSVAIREGVLKNLEITHEHFQNLYDNIPVHYMVYDSSRISSLRGFASGNNIEILVINIDSFAKDENIINRPNDRLSGQLPIEFIRSSNPIVIVDEPQNMETPKRKRAVENLHPLFTLRYSATHRNLYNLIYSLNPVKAYDLGLVKQIEVDSVIEENSSNDAFVSVDSISATKTSVSAKVTIMVNEQKGVTKKSITIRAGDDLYRLSNERETYRDGYNIEEIDASNGSITLSNGNILYKGTTQGALTDEIMKFQIQKTVEEHLKKEIKLQSKGVKVLSLFFIDRVANYRQYDGNGAPVQGKFARWFEEIYSELTKKEAFKLLSNYNIKEVHNGYFSQDRKGVFKDTSGETLADDDTYSLIMKDKEKLLNINNPLRFIFSHSALREGWDNPNVFQICTLNETKSEMKKRQEIGRGLRLAVDSEGKRIYDQNINRLTVIANESYGDFAKALQQEIEEDCGVVFEGRIKNKRERVSIKYRKGFEADPKFLEIWERIKQKTSYRVYYNTEELITNASKAVKNIAPINPPSIRSTKVDIQMTNDGIETTYVGDKIQRQWNRKWQIPDVLGYIQDRTELTRHTLAEIIEQSGRISDILVNPQLFIDLCSQAILGTLNDLMIDGIKYKKVGNSEYEMRLFEEQELETYLNDLSFKVSDNSKTIYEEYIPLDSSVENQFARDCENSEQVKFYFKLPNWFTIPTPIGSYNPDWAIVFEDETKIYFVAETKSTGSSNVDLDKLRKQEQQKIKCGKAHFDQFDDVEYKVVSKIGELI